MTLPDDDDRDANESSAPDAPEGEGTRYTAPSPPDPEATRYGQPPTPSADRDGTRYTAQPADPDATGYTPTSDQPRSRAEQQFPRRFGDYELLAEIARGGMGIVYKARHTRLKRTVALKMILTGQLASPEAVERFQMEARAAANLDHPGIVPVYEVGETDGHHFFTMSLVPGGSLHQLLADGPLPPRDAARLVRQVAEAVQYAHEQGILHRDIKPHNILLQRHDSSPGVHPSDPKTRTEETSRAELATWTPKLTDFGLARTRESGLSVTGEALGTPSYMPPEQAAGDLKRIGPASDVYALGAVLYCLLAGRPPFQSASPMETMRQVLEQDPLPPRRLNLGVPPDLETVCLKCLEKDPRRRYLTAQALAEELGRFELGEPVQARPVARLERGWRWCRRNPVVASLVAAVVVLLLAGTGISTYFAIQTARWAEEALAEKGRADVQAANAQDKAEEARQRAEAEAQARKQADWLRRQAETQKQLAEEQRQRAEGLLYASQIALANRFLQEGNAGRAREVLAATSPVLRGWEYGYLHKTFEDPLGVRPRISRHSPFGLSKISFGPSDSSF
jgi:serine/threonine protein kinase